MGLRSTSEFVLVFCGLNSNLNLNLNLKINFNFPSNLEITGLKIEVAVAVEFAVEKYLILISYTRQKKTISQQQPYFTSFPSNSIIARSTDSLVGFLPVHNHFTPTLKVFFTANNKGNKNKVIKVA